MQFNIFLITLLFLVFFPSYTLVNFRNRLSSYIKKMTNFRMRQRGVFTHLSNCSSLVHSKSGSMMFFMSLVSFFYTHVSKIILLCTKEKVKRVYTFSIVAFVTDFKVIIKNTKMNFKGISMGKKSFLIQLDDTVSSTVTRSLKVPALIGVKSFNKSVKLFFGFLFHFLLILSTPSILQAQTGTKIQGPALVEGFTTITSAAGTTTLTVTSQTKQIVTGSTTQTIVMPDATTLPLGRKFFIINKSSGTVTVNANGGGLLGTVTGGNQVEIHLRAAGSAAGTWDFLSYSSGGGAWGSITGTLSAQTDLQSALDLKAPLASPTFSGTITTPLTASRALVTGASSELAASAVTATQLGYLGTATSDIQTQLNAKQARSTLTTAGDIYVATASATTTRLGPPAIDGRQLVSDSSATNKIRYAAPLVDNFIKNGDAESVTPITTYSDSGEGSTTRPVNGTGGSPNVTTSISSSSPMFDSNSFTLVKDAVNRQGQGWAIPFTIPAGQQAKVLQIEIPYIVLSGTFVAGTSSADSDVIVYLYDVTNSALIEPSSIKLLSNSSTISDKFIANFQTSATGTSYRLIMHVASTSASAYTLKIDDVQVKPSSYVYGTPITDWVAYTPTNLNTTNVSSNTGFWRRVGDKIEVTGRTVWSGNGSGGAWTVQLPSGLSFDTNKMNSTVDDTVLGYAQFRDNGTNFRSTTVGYNSPTTVNFTTDSGTGTITGTGFSASDTLNYSFSGPIQGWSSSTQQSDGYDGRFIGMRYTNSAGTAIGTSAAVLPYPTLVYDSTSSYNTSTGLYTCPATRYYNVQASFTTAGVSLTTTQGVDLYIRLNGTDVDRRLVLGNGASANYNANLPTTVYCQAGQTIGVYAVSSVATTTVTLANLNVLSIEAVQAPTTISATELIAAGYSLSANKTPAANAALDFDTKLYDTHNAVTTGGSGVWKFTAPAPGIYEMCVNAALSSGNQTLDMYKNGVQGKVLMSVSSTVTSGCASVSLIAGDYISANPDGSVTFTATKNTNIYIKRLK